MLRVLIVEDEALVAMEIESMLILAGHDTIGLADDMATAMAAVDIERPWRWSTCSLPMVAAGSMWRRP